MKSKLAKRLMAFFVCILLLSSSIQVNAYLTEDGTEAEMIKLERIVSSSQSKVGKVETITYNLTGDTIVYDPPKEIALVVDVSGSMEWNVNGQKTNVQSEKRITILKNAVKEFVEKWQNKNAKICIVPFSYYVTAAPELVSMKDSDCLTRLNAITDALVANGSTNIGDGMRVAYHTLNNSSNTEAAKYIITLTDGEPNQYSCVSTSEKDKFFKDAGIITSNRSIYNTTKGLQYCTTEIGSMIAGNDKFKSFVIGFATPASLVSNLNKIGTSSGAKVLSNGNYFYYAGSKDELNQTYTDISEIIANDVPFTSAVFSDVLPEGTVIDDAARPQLVQEGFDIQDDYVDSENKVRTKISKPLNGDIVLSRKYPDATTAPQNLIYQLKPYSFTITITYTTPGTKVFEKEDGKIVYDDPFKAKTYTAYCKNSQTVEVIQPVTGLEIGNAIVMVDQEEGPETITAEVLPNTSPNIAYDRAIKSWSVTSAVDADNNPAGLTEIVEISGPADADSLNQIKEVSGLKAGIAYIEAETQGTDIDDNTLKGTSTVYVIDAAVESVSMNKGDTKDLNNCTIKYVPETDTDEVKPEYLTFSGWRLKNASDADYLTVESTGMVTANKTLEHNVEILVDVNYTTGTAGSSDYFNVHKTISCFVVVAQPVTGLEINDAIIMAGSKEQITAAVRPDNAYNLNIKSWKLLDENGNDVTGTSEIVEVTSVSDQFNGIREFTGKKGGVVTVDVETAGFDSTGNSIKKQGKVYVLDATCDEKITVTLWSSGKIVPEPYIPTGLSGEIKFTFTSSDTEYVTVDENTGEIQGCKLTEGTPVAVTIRAEYYDTSGQPTGKVKELTCNVEVGKSNIDIN